MTPYEKLRIMLELSNRLDGKCSMALTTCPQLIMIGNQISEWTCDDCVAMFEGIVDLYSLSLSMKPLLRKPCPCLRVPSIAISRLEEYIEELKQEVSR